MSASAEMIEKLFGSYRAEYFDASYGRLFIPPPYFSQLEAQRPTILSGGRGTGKTTALRSLRFDALETRGRHPSPYLGIYVRINKNRVYAFKTESRSDDHLRRVFAHYFNLLVAAELCELTTWLEDRGELKVLSPHSLERVSRRLCIGHADSLAMLRELVLRGIDDLETYVNNIDAPSIEPPILSIAEAPVSFFARVVHKHDQHGRLVFCCIDEYENLLTIQQEAINTYVKHAETPVSYKIGVKTNGLRSRNTIDDTDPLVAPADYGDLDIARETPDEFLLDVVRRRLEAAQKTVLDLPKEPKALLPALPLLDEAELLGAKRVAESVRDALAQHAGLAEWAAGTRDGRLYFLQYWREAQRGKVTLEALAKDWIATPSTWEQRLGNYGYASLFWLSRGRKGARIRKYYTGCSTFLSLANGNIRFFLQLVHQAIRAMEKKGPRSISNVAHKEQTYAARQVAEYHLAQIDGLCEHGIEIKRLVLAVGKVFFELTRTPEGRQPEPSTFILSGGHSEVASVTSLLDEGVVHLALDASPRTKSTTDTEIRDSEYRLHPILAPFFEITHRRKRRITLRAEDLLQVNREPGKAIRSLLNDAAMTPEEDLPSQLTMFSAFYADGSTGSDSD